jgi:hypothetical protein
MSTLSDLMKLATDIDKLSAKHNHYLWRNIRSPGYEQAVQIYWQGWEQFPKDPDARVAWVEAKLPGAWSYEDADAASENLGFDIDSWREAKRRIDGLREDGRQVG